MRSNKHFDREQIEQSREQRIAVRAADIIMELMSPASKDLTIDKATSGHHDLGYRQSLAMTDMSLSQSEHRLYRLTASKDSEGRDVLERVRDSIVNKFIERLEDDREFAEEAFTHQLEIEKQASEQLEYDRIEGKVEVPFLLSLRIFLAWIYILLKKNFLAKG